MVDTTRQTWSPRTAADALKELVPDRRRFEAISPSGLFVRVRPICEWSLPPEDPQMLEEAEAISDQVAWVLLGYYARRTERAKAQAAQDEAEAQRARENLATMQAFVESARQAMARRAVVEAEAQQQAIEKAAQKAAEVARRAEERKRGFRQIDKDSESTPMRVWADRITASVNAILKKDKRLKEAGLIVAGIFKYKPTNSCMSVGHLNVERNWAEMAALVAGPANAAQHAFFDVIEQHIRCDYCLTLKEWIERQSRYSRNDWSKVFPHPYRIDFQLPGYEERKATLDGKIYIDDRWSMLYMSVSSAFRVEPREQTKRVKVVLDTPTAEQIEPYYRAAMNRFLDEHLDLDEFDERIPMDFQESITCTLEAHERSVHFVGQ